MATLGDLGLSSIANVLGAIKCAKYPRLGPEDVVLTVATDGAEIYRTELSRTGAERFGGVFTELDAAETYGPYLRGAAKDEMPELGRRERKRIFNLGYYIWVEQQGVALADFDRRREQAFWFGLMEQNPVWDGMIDADNAELGAERCFRSLGFSARRGGLRPT